MPLPLIVAGIAIGSALAGGGTAGGIGGLKMSRAKRLVAQKQEEFDTATETTGVLRDQCEAAFIALGTTKARAMHQGLVPFDAAFSRLKNVELDTGVRDDGAPALDLAAIAESGRLTLSTIDTLSIAATGGAVAAGAYAGTQMAVAATATAGTGAAISGLSGAAATNATLAWLGGGTLAAGGGGVAAGTAVLTGVAAAPAVLVGGVFVLLKGRESSKKAAAFEADADAAIALEAQRHLVLEAATSEADRVRALLDALTSDLAREVGWLQSLTDRETDWTLFSPVEQERTRGAAALALAVSGLVHTPVLDDEGSLTRAIRAACDRAAVIAGDVVN